MGGVAALSLVSPGSSWGQGPWKVHSLPLGYTPGQAHIWSPKGA